MSFDNRNIIAISKIVLKRKKGPLHFKIEINGKKIIYCYIRKNACSAFKKLFTDLSKISEKPNENTNPIDFLIKFHRADFPWDFIRADKVIFVYRDPIERIVSLFRNKFIERSGNSDIFKSYHKITGQPPEECTFQQFVFNYIREPWNSLDPHLLPQSRHLLPVNYTDAINISDLEARTSDVFGVDIGIRYFSKKVNTSQDHVSFDINVDVYESPANELRNLFQDGKGMPPTKAFLSSAIIKKIQQIYHEDFELIEKLNST